MTADRLVAPTRLADTDPVPLLDRARSVPSDVIERTNAILERIRLQGDRALQEITKRLDGVKLKDPFLPESDWDVLAEACPDAVRRSIDHNLARIRAFHELQVAGDEPAEQTPGIILGRRAVPYEAAACYVPGGRASYPSSVLMTATPAELAGVREIIVVTPPRPDGSVDAAVAYAARAAGATRILRAGGAQAIAAVAFGTDTVPAVQAIVGPGNQYVTAAKQAVSNFVHTDAPAGPSELLVLAQHGARAEPIALDMVAQAEHDPDAQVILVTDEDRLADNVSLLLEQHAQEAKRHDVVTQSLQAHGAILLADSWGEAVTFADLYAPEHLTILSREPRQDLARIHNAGSVFLGPWASVSLGDYGSGTNHVLPTMGHARNRGGLSVDDFRKWVTWQEVTKEGLQRIADDIMVLAEAEGLHGHAEAIRGRLR